MDGIEVMCFGLATVGHQGSSHSSCCLAGVVVLHRNHSSTQNLYEKAQKCCIERTVRVVAGAAARQVGYCKSRWYDQALQKATTGAELMVGQWTADFQVLWMMEA